MRWAVLQLLMRPKANNLAPGGSARGMANLRMLAAVVYYMAASSLVAAHGQGQGQGGGDDAAAPPAATEAVREWMRLDADETQPFAAELARLLDAAPPSLLEWAHETGNLVATCVRALLRRGNTVAEADGVRGREAE